MNKNIQKILSFIKSHKVFSIFSFCIIVIHLIARKNIQIINAITFESEEMFSIQIQWIKVLLEPIVGLPLFYLRSSQPIEEYIVLWVWIFMLFGIILFVKQQFHFIKYWLISIPAVVGLSYFILVWMIFWPLPSNTIVNKTDNAILFNTHAHSHYSHDGLITQIEQMKWHERNGFDAFFFTEHNHNPNTLDFVQSQASGKISKIPHIMTGIEFSGSNHMVLLGLTDSLITFGKKDSFVISEVHRQGGVVGVAHWFDGQNNSIQHYIESGVNGYEISNSNQLAFPYEIHNDIVSACENNNLFLLGGSDYHGYGPTCGTWNMMEIPDWDLFNHNEKTEAILTGLKNGKNQVIYYSDRGLMPFENIWLSPPINFINYFRGLNIFQVFSWIGLLLIIILLKVKIKFQCAIKGIPIFVGLAILIQGRILHSKSEVVIQHNDILFEFGNLFTMIGFGLFVSGLVIHLILKRFPSVLH